MKHFKVYNSVALMYRYLALHSQHHYLILCFHDLKRNPVPIGSHSPSAHPPTNQNKWEKNKNK